MHPSLSQELSGHSGLRRNLPRETPLINKLSLMVIELKRANYFE